MSREIKRIGTLSYERCANLLCERGARLAGPWRTYKRIGPNTDVWSEEGPPVTYCVTFHSSRILRFHPDGKVTMWHHGHMSTTTKSRLSMLSPYLVYQEKFVWYVKLKGMGMFPPVHTFGDGMTLDPAADLELAREAELRDNLMSDKASGADDLHHLL